MVVTGAISERSSSTDFAVETLGGTDDELAASVRAEWRLVNISYKRLWKEKGAQFHINLYGRYITIVREKIHGKLPLHHDDIANPI